MHKDWEAERLTGCQTTKRPCATGVQGVKVTLTDDEYQILVRGSSAGRTWLLFHILIYSYHLLDHPNTSQGIFVQKLEGTLHCSTASGS